MTHRYETKCHNPIKGEHVHVSIFIHSLFSLHFCAARKKSVFQSETKHPQSIWSYQPLFQREQETGTRINFLCSTYSHQQQILSIIRQNIAYCFTLSMQPLDDNYRAFFQLQLLFRSVQCVDGKPSLVALCSNTWGEAVI